MKKNDDDISIVSDVPFDKVNLEEQLSYLQVRVDGLQGFDPEKTDRFNVLYDE